MSGVEIHVTFARKSRPSRLLAERYESIIMLQQSWNISTAKIAAYLTALEWDCDIHVPRQYSGAMVRTAINIIRKNRRENVRLRSEKKRSK